MAIYSEDRPGYLGPPIVEQAGGDWSQYKTGWQPIRPVGPDGIMTAANPRDLPAHTEGGTPLGVVENPGFQAPPGGAGTGSNAAGSGVDLSGLFAGNIMGIPTWVVVAVAAYFLFFKKK